MNHLLYLRINPDHPLIKFRMIPHQNIRIPRRRDKQGINATPDGRHEYLADLQANQKRKRHDNGREGAAVVVARGGEAQVEVGKEGAEVGDEGGTHGEDGGDEAVVDEGVDAAVFHHSPGVFGGGDVGFTVKRDVGEGVAVDESVWRKEQGS